MRDSDVNGLDYRNAEPEEGSGSGFAHFVIELWIGLLAGAVIMPMAGAVIGGFLYIFVRGPLAWWIGGGIAILLLLLLTAHLGLRRHWWGFATGVMIVLTAGPLAFHAQLVRLLS